MARRSLSGVLLEVVRTLDRAGIDYALIGGLAFSLLVRPRSTVDLDLLVGLDAGDLEELKRILSDAFPDITLHQDAMKVERSALFRSVLPNSPDDDIIVDFLLSVTAIERDALSRTIRVEFEGESLSIISPEDLIVLKTLAGRPQDVVDVQQLRAAWAGRLDDRYIANQLTGVQREQV